MVYDLKKPLDRQQFDTRIAHLVGKGAIVELTEKGYKTQNQNRYIHVLIGAVALTQGETLAYVKENYYKVAANPAIFVVAKDDPFLGKITILRSEASLTKEEMSLSIDRFKTWASHQGIYLPEIGDAERLKEIEYEMARCRKYL